MKTILYILGYGRSGSSLLSWLLNTHSKIMSVGELYRLPSALLEDLIPKFCSCGKEMIVCQLWVNIFEKINTFNFNTFTFNKWNLFLFEQLFKNNLNITTIVDSSCNIKRLKELRKGVLARKFRLKVILLTRDSRGVIYSTSKRGYNLGKRKQPFLRAIISWYVRNKQCINIFNNFGSNDILHIKYEDLVNNTDKTLMTIHKFVNEVQEPMNTNWKKIPPHTFAGNSRIRKSKSNIIKTDEEWKQGFSKYELLLINIFTGRLNRKLANGLNNE